MVTTQDASVGFAIESTYGTGVTPTRFPEFVSETLDWTKAVKQSPALRVGRRVNLKRGRVVTTVSAAGDLNFEAAAKGQGLLWKLLMGAGTSTLVSAGVYQQVFTFADRMPSATVQKVLPDVNGTFFPYTFTGVMCDGFEVTFGDDILQVKATLDARDVTTATEAAVPSYIAGDVTLFSFVGASIFTGTLTEPTSTATASATTAIGYVKSGSISVKHNLQSDRYPLGGGGRKREPLVATRDVTVKLDAEFDTAVLTDAVLNETPMALVVNFAGAALTAGTELLQLVVPCMLPESELPKSNGDKLIVQSQAFTVLSNLASTQPFWVVTRTSDTAL